MHQLPYPLHSALNTFEAMTFAIRPAEVSDISELVTIDHEAFANHPFRDACYGAVSKDGLRKRDIQLFSTHFNSPDARLFIAVETSSGKRAGFSRWQYPHPVPAAQKQARETTENTKDENQASAPLAHIDGMNVPLCEQYYTPLCECEGHWVDREKDLNLFSLAVRPWYQRQGLGSHLTQAGLEHADTAGAGVFAITHPSNVPLFTKLGWQQVDGIVVDMGEYGVDQSVCLIRGTTTDT